MIFHVVGYHIIIQWFQHCTPDNTMAFALKYFVWKISTAYKNHKSYVQYIDRKESGLQHNEGQIGTHIASFTHKEKTIESESSGISVQSISWYSQAPTGKYSYFGVSLWWQWSELLYHSLGLYTDSIWNGI